MHEEDQMTETTPGRPRVKVGTMPSLPQPIPRLVGILFIGLGAGLAAAGTPLVVTLAALAPSVIAVAVIIHASLTPPR
jgi:hypothetical protein